MCIHKHTRIHTGAYLHSVSRAALNLRTNSCSPLLSVSIRWASDSHVSVHGERINVIAEGIGLAWCIFLCEELDLLDSGILQRRACCMGQSHSSCRMFWHILGHRCHKLHRVYTALLKGSQKKQKDAHYTKSYKEHCVFNCLLSIEGI